MASNLAFCDSCDHYDQRTPDPDYISKKWTASSATSTASGRNGRGLNMGNTGTVGKTLEYSDHWVVGWACNFSGTNVSFGSNDILYTLSAANITALARANLEGDGTISIYAGNNNTLIANSGASSPPFSCKPNVFYYFEMKVQCTAGGASHMTVTVTFYVNSVQIMTGTGDCGFNESATLLGIAQGNYHTFGNGGGNTDTILDDFYIVDLSAGGIINDHLGDVAIGVIFPVSDATAQWTNVGGPTTNSGCVNATFPETNVNAGIYIKDNNPSDISNWNWQHIAPFTGTIKGVHYGLYNQKDAESTRSIQQSTQGTPNGPIVYPSDDGRYDFFGMDADPSTGAAWTQAGFNASTFGVVLNS